MDPSEQDLTRANRYLVQPLAPGMDSSWYYPIPYVDFAGLPLTQSDGLDISNWNISASHPRGASYLVTPPAPQPQTWDTLDQGQTNYQYTGNAIISPPQHTSSATAPQTPIAGNFQLTEPNLDPWMWEVATPMTTGMYSRRPSHHSDPGFSTQSFSQDGPTQISFPDTLSRTVSDAITTPRTDLSYTPGQSSSPPAGSSSRNRHIIRCYDHGCNGRTFSSISNLRRHQRERAGQSAVCFCPRCGAPFYRRWTRDHHVMRMSCLRVPRWSGWSQDQNT
ncbi:hypothetical protein D6D26_08301 [Aureobasidium pullulans]|nr:hypothetical protein D6D26_08301 [Aureobasidium pullulans]